VRYVGLLPYHLHLQWWASCSLAATALRSLAPAFALCLCDLPGRGALAFLLLKRLPCVTGASSRFVSLLVALRGLACSGLCSGRLLVFLKWLYILLLLCRVKHACGYSVLSWLPYSTALSLCTEVLSQPGFFVQRTLYKLRVSTTFCLFKLVLCSCEAASASAVF
jgi:hypothetical protein